MQNHMENLLCDLYMLYNQSFLWYEISAVLNKKEGIYFLLISFLRFEDLDSEKNVLVTGSNKCVVKQRNTQARDVVNYRKMCFIMKW